MPPSHHQQQHQHNQHHQPWLWSRRQRAIAHMAAGVGLASLPVLAWWLWARSERQAALDRFTERRANKMGPAALALAMGGGVVDPYDAMILDHDIQAGDVLVFDRRCERCAASPWAAVACFAAKHCLLVHPSQSPSSSSGAVRLDHVGLVVPGYSTNTNNINTTNANTILDPTNLLLMEATPSGIVARPLQARLELSASSGILLIPLSCPGEQHKHHHPQSQQHQPQQPALAQSSSSSSSSQTIPLSSQQLSVHRTRAHVDKELLRFRDTWLAAGQAQQYAQFHSTVTLGGALLHRLVMQLNSWTTTTRSNNNNGSTTNNDNSNISSSSSSSNYQQSTSSKRLPSFVLGGSDAIVTSPSAYLVLKGLQAAAAATALAELDTRTVKPCDFVPQRAAYRQRGNNNDDDDDANPVQLRPGWRFGSPVPLKQQRISSSY